MSYKTVEVELENGHVRASGAEALPAKAHALLTFEVGATVGPALTCSELADRWMNIERLPLDEGNSFADDIEQSRASLPRLKTAWD